MKFILSFTTVFALHAIRSNGFVQHDTKTFSRQQNALGAKPTMEQLSGDPFMKQVSHAAAIVPLLSSKDDEQLSEMLQVQLSHSDGIRGFFVNYLTAEGETPADQAEVPPPLASALKTIQDRDNLISLAAMNVVMPTAMSTMHTDEKLQASSAKTAERGIKILEYLATLDPDSVKPTCQAILAAADDDANHSADVEYWRKFFVNYGYEEKQKKDIASVISVIHG